MIALVLIAASTPSPPSPIPPEINQAFDCRVFREAGGIPFRIYGTARTLLRQPKTISDPVEVRFESTNATFPSFQQTVDVLTVARSSVTATDERTARRHINYHFLINEAAGVQPPNGAVLITEWADAGPAKYVGVGICDLQPLEVSQ